MQGALYNVRLPKKSPVLMSLEGSISVEIERLGQARFLVSSSLTSRRWSGTALVSRVLVVSCTSLSAIR
jgi:hypothetical protein